MRNIINFIIIAIIFGICFVIGGAFYFIHYHHIDFSVLSRYKSDNPSIVLDDEGHEWARFQLDRRDPITYEKIPPHLINAFIAAEDWQFFSHGGLSWRGIIRSTLVNLYHGRKMQGASTITQQLVRLLFFDCQKTFRRKIKEQLYALLIERQYTKEQIMEMYLNHVYLGCGIYGVEAACQRFWHKHALDITIDEAATLAAIVQLPEHYCPLNYPLSAQKRRNIVLFNMKKLHFISTEEHEQAKSKAVQCIANSGEIQAPHAKEAIRLMLEEIVGKEVLYGGGLIIQSTINSTVQKRAEIAFAKNVKQIREKINAMADGALISMDTKTGAIKALIGGHDFNSSQFNRALQAKRQMGSIIKPLIYTIAMEAGRSFAETEIDEPVQIVFGSNTWQPNNWDQQFVGQITLAYALSRSNNIVSIKTLLHSGIDKVIALATQCHLEGPFNPYPSLALGCVDATVKEAIGMFNIFPNHGVYVEPHLISWVKDSWGKKIWRYTPKHETILNQQISDKVAKVLAIGMERIRLNWYQGKWLSCESICKTGTTNECRTCWFAGATPELTTVIYIGRDDNKPLGEQVYPLTTAFPIWKDLYESIKHPQQQFIFDPHLHEIIIDEKTGSRLSDTEQEGAIKIFE